MRQLVAGDKPTAIKMGNMDLQMAQVADDADEESTGFKLPSMNNLFGNQTSDGTKQSVGAMVRDVIYTVLTCRTNEIRSLQRSNIRIFSLQIKKLLDKSFIV